MQNLSALPDAPISIVRAHLSRTQSGETIACAIIENTVTGATHMLTEFISADPMVGDMIFETMRDTPFARALTRFLMADFDDEAQETLKYNNAFDIVAASRYCEIAERLDRVFAPIAGPQRMEA